MGYDMIRAMENRLNIAPPLPAITVYCSSSSHAPHIYFQAAEALGRAIALESWTLVYGGNACGCMKALADGARAANGKVIGVTPQSLVDKGLSDKQCNELIVTNNMRDRKAILESRGDAFIALPGGLGTFEEIFEIIVGRQLGYHAKPIVILNIAGYYDPLLAMLTHGVEHGFIKSSSMDFFEVKTDVPSTIRSLRDAMTNNVIRHSRSCLSSISSNPSRVIADNMVR